MLQAGNGGYRIPLIYVYEPEKELVWLISREDLERELGHLSSLTP
jgi:hypothetical protein